MRARLLACSALVALGCVPQTTPPPSRLVEVNGLAACPDDESCHAFRAITGASRFEGAPRDDRRFESALYELMRVVEERYRVRAPAFLPE